MRTTAVRPERKPFVGESTCETTRSMAAAVAAPVPWYGAARMALLTLLAVV